MFTSFTIKNFRGFENLTVKPLARVNLFTGKNNVGKTALLEALLLQTGPTNIEIPLRLDRTRGISYASTNADDVWGWLFFGRQTDRMIEMTSVDDAGASRLLQIRLEEVKEEDVRPWEPDLPSPPDTLTTAGRPRELTMTVVESPNYTGSVRARLVGDKIALGRPLHSNLPLCFFLTAGRRPTKEDVERLSLLEAAGRQAEVLEPLRVIEPRLQRLAVLVIGGAPLIHADVGVGRLIPLPVMGEGLGSLVSVLLAIVHAPNGTVLIDEIENGLHHSVLEHVWIAIADAARRANVQVVATTHSYECVRAAYAAFGQGKASDFRLHRLERVDGNIRDIAYDDEAFDAAMKFEFEVR